MSEIGIRQNEIVDTCKKIKKFKCRGCGGQIGLDGRCTGNCGNKYPEFVELIEKLKGLLYDHKVTFEAFAELVNIRNLKIPEVEDVIVKRTPKIQHFVDYCTEHNEYGPIINLLLKANCETITNPDYFYHIYYQYFAGKLDNLSDDDYIKFLELFAKRYMALSEFKTFTNHTPVVDFISNKEMVELSSKKGANVTTCGVCVSGNFIHLNRDNFINNRFNNKEENIITIFHEFQHVIEPNNYTNPKHFRIVGLWMAKDNILRNLMPNYYKENYSLLATELSAEYNGQLFTMTDAQQFGLNSSISKDKLEQLKMQINSIRMVNGEPHELDEIFDHFLYLFDATVLDRYPILNLEYKLNTNGKLEAKSIEEIENTINGLEQTQLLQELLSYFKEKKAKTQI